MRAREAAKFFAVVSTVEQILAAKSRNAAKISLAIVTSKKHAAKIWQLVRLELETLCSSRLSYGRVC